MKSYPVAKAWMVFLFVFAIEKAEVSSVQAAVDKTLLKSQEGTAALLRGRYDQAVLAFDEAVKDTSIPAARQATLYCDRGVAKWRLQQPDAALQDFAKAIELNVSYAPAYNNRGNVLLQLNRIEDAYKDFDTAISLSSAFGAAYSNRAIVGEKLKRFDVADEDFKKAIELMPTSSVPYNGRGKIAGELNRYYTSLRYLNRAIGLNPQYAPAYQNRANILVRLDRYGDAIEDLDKIIALAPDKSASYEKRGQAYEKLNKTQAAFRDYGQALELDHNNIEALVGRAAQNIDRKKIDLALTDLNQAIGIAPANAEAYFWRGQAYRAANDLVASEKDIDKAIEIDPNFSDAYRIRGSYREASGQHDAAITDYRHALELDPFSRELRNEYKTISGETAASIIKPIGTSVNGWDVYKTTQGRFYAFNERYAKLPILLEMQGEGDAELKEWTPLKDWLLGIGLLRYQAGSKKGKIYEYVAIVDLNRDTVVTIEPYLWGDQKSKWDWAQNSVAVTDPDGLTSTYELRRPKPVEQPRVATDEDGFNIWGDSRSRDRGSRRQMPRIFGWLFQ